MNNRLKYRIWDKNQNKMLIPQDNINYCYIGGYVVSVEVYKSMDGSIKPVIRPNAIYDNAVLMQCIGLKDKNGKLIYEGDILKIDEIGRLVVVRFKGISFELFAEPTNLVGYHNDKYIPEDCEIVGNIYENKELLNE